MPRIRLLPPELISRIAAGECVERPASVIKELVENALDAGASRIDVRIEDGGRELIQVSDDGCGIAADDLPLCVAQHATSKILADDDLFNIQTMGFRGEALASIGAVARVQITSRTPDADVGAQIRVDASKVSDVKPVAAPVGTSIEVRDLFHNVPARRKFLKTNQTESGHVTEQFARIALAQPGVALSLYNGKRAVHQLEAADNRLQRIGDLYGRELADVLLPIRREGHDALVEGYVAPPAESRGSSKWEYVFVNGRYVRDRFVSHAIKEAYRSLIDPRRFPVAFLFITIDPEAIDVNVHPMKTEIRWRDSNYVHAQVLAALRERFLTSKLDHELRAPASEDEGYRARVRAALVDFFTRSQPQEGRAPQQPPPAPNRQTPGLFNRAGGGLRVVASDSAAAANAAASNANPPAAQDMAPAPHSDATPDAEPDPAPRAGSDYTPHIVPSDDDEAPAGPPRAIQVHNMYILAETDEGLMIVDQHALHERILYEGLRARLGQRPLESQRLLLPEVVRVPADRIEALETHADMLSRLGLELNAVGPDSVALQAFPTLLSERRVDAQAFIRDLLDKLCEQGARPDADTLVHDVLDMMACKAAVKAGDPLTPQEIDALLARRDQAERTSHCPHGRPTTLHLSLRDLEKQFHRR